MPIAQAAEQEMVRDIAKVLRQAKVMSAYKRNVTLGTEEYMVPFAFAHMTGDHRADRALRPLNFDLTTPTEIYNHGDQWITRLKRLERQGYRPDRVLFALRAPSRRDDLHHKAFDEIRHELEGHGYEVPAEQDADRIVKFARIPESEDFKLAE